jgi:hypothetical protein
MDPYEDQSFWSGIIAVVALTLVWVAYILVKY